MKSMAILSTLLPALLFFQSTVHADEAPGVSGKITFNGTPPAPQKRIISKDPEICGQGYREFQEVRTDASGGLRDVVVYLDSDELPFAWDHPEEWYTLNQKGCQFDPFVLIFPRDAKARLNIVNSDPTLHNVRISQVLGRVKPVLLNLAQPSGGKPKLKPLRLKKGSHVIEVKCDAHDFMEGWMFAVDNPYCTVVNEDGTFSISNVPPGEHTFKAWHPYLGTVEQTVTVNDNSSADIQFEFTKKAAAEK